MTQLSATETCGDLEAYRARETALRVVRDALETADKWDTFVDLLAARGYPEARIHQVVGVPVTMDLHLHSTHSDGRIPARKLAWLARVIGLRTIALADHDSVAGSRELYGEALLLGLQALPAVELSTDQPGLEILVYFPDAGRFFDLLTTPRGVKFLKALDRKQEEVHEITLAALESVNRWLKRQGIPADRLITEAELDAWFGGCKPYYPGTLAVLGLQRLDEAQREALGLRDPRTFNTKVVAPALKRLRHTGGSGQIDLKGAVADVKKQLASLRHSRTGSVAILAHPKELVTKGRLSLGKVARTIEFLVQEIGLDGIEIGCARDDADDVRVWTEIVEDVNAKIAAKELKAPGPLLVASYTSDFHVLAPGRASGEITLGFGLLDERPGYRLGNLRPQTAPEEWLDAMRRRAALRCED